MKKSKWLIWILIIIIIAFTGCSLPFKNTSEDAAKNDPLTKSSEEMVPSNKSKSAEGNSEESSGIKPENNQTDAKSKQANLSDNLKGVKSEQTLSNSSYMLVTLFYQDAGKSIVPVTRRIEKQEAIARTAVTGLIDDPINREELEYYGVYPVLPKDTRILGVDIKEGIATIDFNSKLLSYKDELSERNIISAIVYTLTEFKNITGVKISVEGRTLKLQYGSDISGVLKRDNILINSSKVNLTQGLQKADIFLFKQSGTNYSNITPVSVQFEQVKKEELPSMIVEMLVKDYSSRKLLTQLPQKTKLLGSEINGNVLTLNFNTELRNYGGTAREEGIIRQLLYSMKQVKGVDKIRIQVEGKDTILPEGSEVSRGLSIPNSINDFIDDY